MVRALVGAALLLAGPAAAQSPFLPTDREPACAGLVASDWTCADGACTPISEWGGTAVHGGASVSAASATCANNELVLQNVVVRADNGALWQADVATTYESGWWFTGNVVRAGMPREDGPYPPTEAAAHRSGLASAGLGLVPVAAPARASQQLDARVGALVALPDAAVLSAIEAGGSGVGGTLALTDRDGRLLRVDILSGPNTSGLALVAFGDAQWTSNDRRVRLWTRADAGTLEHRQLLSFDTALASSERQAMDAGLAFDDGPILVSLALRDPTGEAPAVDGDLRLDHRDATLATHLHAAAHAPITNGAGLQPPGVALEAGSYVTLREQCLRLRPGVRLASITTQSGDDTSETDSRLEILAHTELACARGPLEAAAWAGATARALGASAAPEFDNGPWRPDEGMWAASLRLGLFGGGLRGRGGVEFVARHRESDDAARVRATALAATRGVQGSLSLTHDAATGGTGIGGNVQAAVDAVGWTVDVQWKDGGAPSGNDATATHGQLALRRTTLRLTDATGAASSAWLRVGVVRAESGIHAVGSDLRDVGFYQSVTARPAGADFALHLDVGRAPGQQVPLAFVSVEFGDNPHLPARAHTRLRHVR